MMVFISCNLELEAFMEYHMVLVYTGNQLQLWEDTDLELKMKIATFVLKHSFTFVVSSLCFDVYS